MWKIGQIVSMIRKRSPGPPSVHIIVADLPAKADEYHYKLNEL